MYYFLDFFITFIFIRDQLIIIELFSIGMLWLRTSDLRCIRLHLFCENKKLGKKNLGTDFEASEI